MSMLEICMAPVDLNHSSTGVLSVANWAGPATRRPSRSIIAVSTGEVPCTPAYITWLGRSGHETASTN